MPIQEVTTLPHPLAVIPATNLFQFKLQYGRDEAAEMIGVSLRTLDRLIAENHLSVRRIGRRVLVTRDVLVQFTKRDHPTGGAQ